MSEMTSGLVERIEAVREGLQTLEGLARHTIKTDQPDRVKWQGEWHYGPLATAYLETVEEVSKLAGRLLQVLPARAPLPAPPAKDTI